ncbi:hypothetical protein [Pacificibacter marinus]|nr:hypothetical protein [Pacificibacter marinus]
MSSFSSGVDAVVLRLAARQEFEALERKVGRGDADAQGPPVKTRGRARVQDDLGLGGGAGRVLAGPIDEWSAAQI